MDLAEIKAPVSNAVKDADPLCEGNAIKTKGALKPMIPLNEISTPALAYLGDCVLELMVREHLVQKGISASGKLNSAALSFVRASAQAAAMERMLPLLSEEEEKYYRRGRNSTHLNIPKSARPAEYRMATGMEVLFGFLHLSGQTERARVLFAAAYPAEEPM